MPRRGAPNPPPAPNAPPAPLIITNPHLLDEDIPPPHPDEQYAPLGTDASYRKQRIIDLALQDPCLAESCLARMRVYEPVPNQPPNRRAQDIRYTRRLELAPLDWYEFYSNLRVESWVYMWVHAFDEGPTRGGQLGIKAEYQYHIPGPYKIRSREWDDDPQFSREAVRRFKVPTHGPGRQVKAAFVDFIWLPPANDRAGVNPIVMMEVDENNHYSAGWDAERYREVFILQELAKLYPRNKNILIIRFNPHEYKNKAKHDVDANRPNVYTTGVPRNERMYNLGELILWAYEKNSNKNEVAPMKPGITIAFAYYDKWYSGDTEADPWPPIHMHNYRDRRAYLSEVHGASGNRVLLQDRQMFKNNTLTWWQCTNAAARIVDAETTRALNPFAKFSEEAKAHVRELLGPAAPAPIPPGNPGAVPVPAAVPPGPPGPPGQNPPVPPRRGRARGGGGPPPPPRRSDRLNPRLRSGRL